MGGGSQNSHSLCFCKLSIIAPPTLSEETFPFRFLHNDLWKTMKEREFMLSCR